MKYNRLIELKEEYYSNKSKFTDLANSTFSLPRVATKNEVPLVADTPDDSCCSTPDTPVDFCCSTDDELHKLIKQNATLEGELQKGASTFGIEAISYPDI